MEGHCFSPVEKPLGIKLLIRLHHHLTPSFISDPMRAITTTQAAAYFLVLKMSFFFIYLLSVDKEQAKQVISHPGRIRSNTHILVPRQSPGGLRMLHTQMVRGQERQMVLCSPFFFTFCASKTATMYANCQTGQRLCFQLINMIGFFMFFQTHEL